MYEKELADGLVDAVSIEVNQLNCCCCWLLTYSSCGSLFQ